MTEAGREFNNAIAAGDNQRVLEIIRANQALIASRLPGNARPFTAAALRHNLDLVEQLRALGAPLDIVTAVILHRIDSVREALQSSPVSIYKRSPDG